MRNKFFFIVVLVLSFGLSSASAQTPASTSAQTNRGTISGGVLNGKASSLPKPAYPAAARAVNASGAVNVQVTIDENGDVISASAVSGHPLLRQASEQAARASKFLPTKLEGQPVKVTGVIVYNFVLPMTFSQIGYELSLAEKTKTITRYQISSIGGAFPREWEDENEALKKLDLYLTDQMQKNKNLQTLPPVNTDADKPVRSKNILTVSTVGPASVDYTLDGNSVTAIRELQSKIENRLSVNETALSSFRLGVILGKLKAEIESDEKTLANISELNQLRLSSPNVSDWTSAKIREITEFSAQNTTAAERTEKLLPLIENLKNTRSF